ncbi:MAG: molybdopterin-dependent oxidoreductase [Xanthomonadales bacterium]|nr:molybdopterin-dependent oxidoreductase [Xanthomonadales bacterium]
MSGVDRGRRSFLASASGASGLALTLQLMPGRHLLAAVTGQGGERPEFAPSLFVAMDQKGTVRVTCHRSEMGQQIRTSIAQIIADEMEADWARVVVEQAIGHPRYGDQNTDGSRSVRRNLKRLRQAGAAARQLMVQAAAKAWEVPASECEAVQHRVTHTPSGKSLDYSELADLAAKLPVPDPESVRLKSRDQWRLIGKAVQSIEMDSVIHGKTMFAGDIRLPDMAFAAIARPPVLFGTVKSVDDSAARKIPGVIDVLRLPALEPPAGFKALGGVAVLATSTWAAFRARDALLIEWDHGANSVYNSKEYRESMLETVRQPGTVVRKHGDIEAALAGSSRRISAEYTVPHLSQAPMEPPAATARMDGDGIEIWACTQTPQATRGTVAAVLGLEPDNVTVNVTLLGGAFGRKSKPDFSVEAALLAREAKRPVQVVWSREDDTRNGYYHSVSAQRVEGALDADGNTVAWHHRTTFPTISSTFSPTANSPSSGELDLGFVDNPFEIPSMQLEKGDAEAHVRIGWLRSVANVYHAFAVQSFAHELAVAANRDPRDYLLQLIGSPRKVDLSGVEYGNYGDPIDVYPVDTERLSNVVRRAAKLADWDGKRQQGRALGIAAHRSFLTYAATVVEVTVDENGRWQIPGVYVSIDAGTVVNTDHVRNQCEGGSVYGLSCAIGQITATSGVVDQGNFNDFLVTRMNQAPRHIEVDIVESDAPPAGVGEPPTPPFAPAFANALYEATGKRFRHLPIPLTV